MAFYDQFFACGPTRLGGRMNRRLAGAHWQAIRRLQAAAPQVVEIGPGGGEFAATCIPEAAGYRAVDANARICETVRALGGEAVQAMAPPVPFADASADVVYASSVLEHMPDPLRALELVREMTRIAVPGGLVVIFTPDILSCGFHFWNSEYSHAFPTSRRRLLQLAADAGLTPLHAGYYAGPFGGVPGALLAFAMRLFPHRLASACCLGLVDSDRFYKTRTAFMRSVLLIARKAPSVEGPTRG